MPATSFSLVISEMDKMLGVIQNCLFPLPDGQCVLVRLGTSFPPGGKETNFVLVSLAGSWGWEAGGGTGVSLGSGGSSERVGALCDPSVSLVTQHFPAGRERTQLPHLLSALCLLKPPRIQRPWTQ